MKFEKVSVERVSSKLNTDKLNLTFNLYQKTSKEILNDVDLNDKCDKDIFYSTSLYIDDEDNSDEEGRYIPENVFRKQYIPHNFHNPVYRSNINTESIINALNNQSFINSNISCEQVSLAASLSSHNLTTSTSNIHEAINQATNRSENQTNYSIISRQNSQTLYRSSSSTISLQPLSSESNNLTGPNNSENYLNRS
ncbi:hypothetical protein H8356DRAFT_1623269 [Neocallimastix lanati (nom. inval.)]|nr:hypothetical protein H8356DRAFT_1623269 [Neocallimastix sp. JGI-2020a]